MLQPHIWIAWVLSCVVACCPLAAEPDTAKEPVWRVEIQALGQRNPASKGSEVWVYEIRTPEEIFDWKNAEQGHDKCWEFRPKPGAAGGIAALAAQTKPCLLRAAAHGELLTIKLVKHSWSGMARITVNGETRVLDLYSPADPHFEVVRFTGVKKGASKIGGGASKWIYLAAVALLLALAGWFVRSRKGSRSSASSRRTPPFWVRAPSRRIAVAALGAAPLSFPFTALMFGSGGIANHLLGYAYALMLCFGALTLWSFWYWDDTAPPGSARATRFYWLIAAILSGVAATAAAGALENHLNNQRACWVEVTLRTDAPQPPPLAVQYGPSPAETSKFEWQPYRHTYISLRRLDGRANGDIRIENIMADGKPVDMSDIIIQGGIPEGRFLTIAAPEGLLHWPTPARTVSLSVSGSNERIRLGWLDQTQIVEAKPGGQSVLFDLGGAYQGWALLPPQQIDSLAIVPEAALRSAYGITGKIFTDPPQEATMGDVRFRTARSAVRWPLMKPLNARHPAVLVAAWLAVWATCLLSALLLRKGSSWWDRGPMRSSLPWAKPQQKGASGQFVRTAVLLWMICAAYHLVFVLTVRTGFTNDSIGYYDMARQVAISPELNDIVIARTPGYPFFLAGLQWLFGDTVLGIALVQHLALATLSVLVLWRLWGLMPRPWAFGAALLAGLAPAVSPMANIVWTESLFCALACAALLFASSEHRRPFFVGLAGLCAGMATMVRPNGLLLVAAIGVCITLRFLWLGSRHAWREYVLAGFALIGGYLMVAAPWHLHLAVERRSFTLAKGLKEFGSWAGFVYQHRLPADLPINRPNAGVLTAPSTYQNDPYILQDRMPLIRGDELLYYRETENEWLATQSLLPFAATLEYYLTLRANPSLLPFTANEIRGFLSAWLRPATGPGAGGVGSVSVLAASASAPPPGPHILGLLCIWLSVLVLSFCWGWLTLASLVFGAAAVLFRPALLPVLLYSVGTIFLFSTNLVPGERYVAVLEPVYYVLCICGLYVSWVLIQNRLSFRQRSVLEAGAAGTR